MHFKGLGSFLRFKNKELTGAFLLIVITVLIAIIPRIIQSNKGPVQLDFTEDSQQINLLIHRDKAFADSLRKAKYNRLSIYNTTAADWAKLGVKPADVEKIKRHLQSGKFASYSEISRLAGIDSQEIKKFISLYPKSPKGNETDYRYSNLNPLEINSADSLQLIDLKGIGPYYAHKILNFRKKLGGYYSVKQLYEIHGFDTTALSTILTSLTVNVLSINKLEITDMERTRLENHPYLSKKQVGLILAYRTQHGHLTLEEFKKHPAFSPELKAKLQHYLKFDMK